MTFANLPSQRKTSSGVTRTKASPELTEEARGETSRAWHTRRPFTYKRDGGGVEYLSLQANISLDSLSLLKKR